MIDKLSSNRGGRGGIFLLRACRRDDIFRDGVFIETAGGGVEEGESTEEAIHRELKEELGVKVEVLCKIGLR